MTHKVSRVRRCTECKETFATPDSFRQHKHKGGFCRSAEALEAAGFKQTPKGWVRGKDDDRS